MNGPKRSYLESLPPGVLGYLRLRMWQRETLSDQAIEAEAITLFYYWVRRLRLQRDCQ